MDAVMEARTTMATGTYACRCNLLQTGFFHVVLEETFGLLDCFDPTRLIWDLE